MKIAVLLTCFNRKEKTCKCLQSLYTDLGKYNKIETNQKISIEVFLVDDGCTDGTADAISTQYADKSVHIIQGSGSLFWAGGMRLAWSVAYKRHSEWDFYLLMNDDTELLPGALQELLETHQYALNVYKMEGIYSGITCASDDYTKRTYSGRIWVNRFKGTTKYIGISNSPQICELVNANILLVHKSVVDKIGRFSGSYQHGFADYDYSIRARKKDIPVLVSAKACGICDNDHLDKEYQAQCVINMSLVERCKYFRHPAHSSGDYLRFIWNNSPLRWPMVFIGRLLNLFLPRLYYKLNSQR